MRVGRGEREFLGDPDVDWRIDAPTTLRWRYGEHRWTTGAAPPLGFRIGAATAFDGARLAVVGGTQRSPDEPLAAAPDPRVARDGAIYDLATDTWDEMPPMATPDVVWASASWSRGQLLVGGGTDHTDGRGDRRQLSAYDPHIARWTTLEAAPYGVVHASDNGLVAARDHSSEGPRPVLLYANTGWETAPFPDLRDVDGLLVASTASTSGNPGDDAFDLAVRIRPQEWLRGATAPFTNLLGAAIAVTADRLVVVGGYEGSGLEERADTWIYDLVP